MFKKISYNSIMLVLTLVSIFLAIFFYFKSIKSKSISYYTTNPSIIYDSKIVSPSLKLYDSNNNPITNDIMVSYFVLWNSGDLPINKEDIRKKVEITISGPSEIYNYSVLRESNPDISNFQIKLVRKDIKEQLCQFEISWDYFDPDFSAKFQFIFSNSVSINYEITGNILGINKFEKVTTSNNFLRGIYLGIFVGLLVNVGTFILLRKNIGWKRYAYSLSFIVIMIIIYFIIRNFLLYSSKIPLMYKLLTQ